MTSLNLSYDITGSKTKCHNDSLGLKKRYNVQVDKDQEKAQSERDSHSKLEPRWEKTKLTTRHLYHETYRKPNEQLFPQ